MAKKKRVNTEQVRIQNAAKSLVANIRFASIDKQVRSLVVTSSVPNEGKTTVAIALAQAMASLGERVLLVECDMRRRSLANLLGANSHYGLYSVVCGEADLEDAVATTSTRGLHFLDVEPHHMLAHGKISALTKWYGCWSAISPIMSFTITCLVSRGFSKIILRRAIRASTCSISSVFPR